jgi:hypothetical protein
MRLSHPEDQVPVVPGTFGELSRSGFTQRVLELFITQRCAQRLHISMSSDIHDLGYQSAAVVERALGRLPPDVLTGEWYQVHGEILQIAGTRRE